LEDKNKRMEVWKEKQKVERSEIQAVKHGEKEKNGRIKKSKAGRLEDKNRRMEV